MVGGYLDGDFYHVPLLVHPGDGPAVVPAANLVVTRTLIGVATDPTLAALRTILVLERKISKQ